MSANIKNLETQNLELKEENQILKSKVEAFEKQINFISNKENFSSNYFKFPLINEDNKFIDFEDAILISDIKGKIINCNEKLLQLLNYNLDEIVNLNINQVIKFDDQTKLLDIFNDKINIYGFSSSYEVEVIRKNNSFGFVEFRTFLTYNELNEKIGYYSIIKDIEYRKRKEIKSEENIQQFKAIFDYNPNAIAINRLDTGEYTAVNPAFLKSISAKEEDILGKNAIELGFADIETFNNSKAYLMQNKYYEGLEHFTKNPNGKDIWIMYSAVIVKINNEDFVISTTVDITDRKNNELLLKEQNLILEEKVKERTHEFELVLDKLSVSNFELNILNGNLISESQRIISLNEELNESQKQLEKALNTKNLFMSIIGHDLKNPLNGITITLELLKNYNNKISEDKKLYYINNLYNTTNSLLELLNNLLAWSSSESKMLKLQVEYSNLSQQFDSVLVIMQNLIENKKITIQNQINKEIFAYFDLNTINTVLRNLISNALKFTKINGTITLSTLKLNNDFIQVSIKDNGIGIPENKIEKLFSSENRFTTEGTNNESGTGLGLIICKDFIEKNGGKLGVKSIVNEGSEFYFSLPLNKNS